MSQDLLVEIGTEELPPTALSSLSQYFTQHIINQLEDLSLNYNQVQSFATPRRLAVLITSLDEQQPDKTVERKGPPVKAAFTADGQPTKAAEGFARSCNTTVDTLKQIDTDKGLCISYAFIQSGKHINELIPDVIKTALDKLPIPKRMRWADLDVQFVRPVHWLVVLYGSTIINCEILSVHASNLTYGHRFHHPQAIKLTCAADYQNMLFKQGKVIASFKDRENIIIGREASDRKSPERLCEK